MDELRTLDIGEGEHMPTLHELLTLIQRAPDMLINIELKGPYHDEFKIRYDFYKAAKIVAENIDCFKIAHRTIVSSFEPLITNSIKVVSNRKFKVVQLMNRGLKDELEYKTPEGMQGINLSFHNLR